MVARIQHPGRRVGINILRGVENESPMIPNWSDHHVDLKHIPTLIEGTYYHDVIFCIKFRRDESSAGLVKGWSI